jgi:hypothetical protein
MSLSMILSLIYIAIATICLLPFLRLDVYPAVKGLCFGGTWMLLLCFIHGRDCSKQSHASLHQEFEEGSD